MTFDRVSGRREPGRVFPKGCIAPQARAGSDPESGKRAGKSRPLPGRPSGGWRGVAPSPVLRANAENGGEDDLPEGQRGLGLSRTARCAGSGKSSGKRGRSPFCRELLTPKAAQLAAKAVLRCSKRDGQLFGGLVGAVGEQGRAGEVSEADCAGAAPAIVRAVEGRPQGTLRKPERGWSHERGSVFPQGPVAPEARAGSDPAPRINRRMKRRVSGL